MGHAAAGHGSTYEVRVRGRLDEDWADSFPGFAMRHAVDEDGTPITVLSGLVVDEAALHGHLARIRDLGIPLLLVRRVDSKPGVREADG